MELLQIYNGETIESVRVEEGSSVCRLVYKKERKNIFGHRKAGFYEDYSGHYYGTAEDLLNGSYNGYRILVKDNVAYWRPFVHVNLVSGKGTGKHFDTIEDCNAYAQEVMNTYVEKRNHFIVEK